MKCPILLPDVIANMSVRCGHEATRFRISRSTEPRVLGVCKYHMERFKWESQYPYDTYEAAQLELLRRLL